MISRWIGAWGPMSGKARTRSLSYKTWVGISFLAILQKMQESMVPPRLFVDLFLVEQLLADGLHLVAFDLVEEAAAITGVAGGDVLLDLDQQGVGVAIEIDLFHLLGVAAGLALHPEFFARTRPVGG